MTGASAGLTNFFPTGAGSLLIVAVGKTFVVAALEESVAVIYGSVSILYSILTDMGLITCLRPERSTTYSPLGVSNSAGVLMHVAESIVTVIGPLLVGIVTRIIGVALISFDNVST